MPFVSLTRFRWALWALLLPGAFASEDGRLPRVEVVFPQVEPLLREALEQSPRMIARNLDLLQNQQAIQVFNARLLPRLDAGFQYNLQQDDREGLLEPVSSQKLTYDVRLSQPLYHWGALRAGARVGTIQAEIAANNVAEAYRLLALEIRASFLNLVLLKTAVRNVAFESELAGKRLAIAETRLRTGQEAPSVVSLAKQTIEELELQSARSNHAFESAVRNFHRLVGSSSFDGAQVPEAIPPITRAADARTGPLRADYVETRGFEKTNRFQNLVLELEKERLNERVLRTNLRPKVDAVAGLFQDELSYTLDVSRRDRISSTFVGVRVGWNVFDGFSTRGNLRMLLTRQRQLRQQLEELSGDLVNASADAARELEFAGRSLEFAERGLAGSEGMLAQARDNLAKGRVSQDEVDATRYRVNNSLYATFAARASYLNALASYLSQVNADPIVVDATRQLLKR